MASEPVLGHEETLEGLWRAAGAARLPHALLFEGPAGIGRFRAARRLAQGLFCAAGPGAPCGRCGPCKRFAAGSHPDLYVLDPGALELETIPIGYVTPRQDGPKVPTIEEFLSLRPAEGGWRVVLVREFERAGVPTQNALLKTLEEPGRATLLVLECARPERLLETILSRCARVRFAPLSAADGAAVLAEAGLERERAARLARWAGGAPGRALKLAAEEAEATRGLLEGLLDGALGPFELAPRLEDAGGRFRGETELARARTRAAAAVELGLELVGDLARVRAGVDPAGLPHGDLAARLARGVPDGALAAAADALLQARRDVDSNLDPVGVLDRAAFALAALAPARVPHVRGARR